MDLTDIIIQLVVPSSAGETVRLNVHRGVLCKSSAFLKNAIKPEWTTQEEKIVNLPEDLAGTVINHIKWLYFDRIVIKLYEVREDTIDKRAEEAEKMFRLLADAYVFGEKIIDLQYKKAVMEAIFAAQKSSHWHMGPESVNIVYEGTPSESPLRRLVADNMAYKVYDDLEKELGWMQFISRCPRDALIDAMKVMVKVRPVSRKVSP